VKPFKKVLLAILLIPILLIVASFFLPSSYHVQREKVIHAPAEAIYPWLSQLKKWPDWTVWNTNSDPTLVYSYPGATEGTGAEMTWTARSGKGSLKLSSADARTGVKYELNFEEGKFLSSGGVTMTPEGNATRVAFSNEGNFGKNPVRRYMGLLMDKMMGAQFDENLSRLKAKVEPK